ncbi:MAG: hypothetical protein E7599_06240 [Ruminococcaceae bacterium]|nr:hypothetical protein [Oscillospiraceae bacterium]
MMSNSMLRILLAITAVLYYAAFACSLFEKKAKLPTSLKYGFWVAGAAANAVAIVNNYFHNGHVPFISIFQVLIVLGLCFVPFYLYLTYVCKCRGYFPVFSFASAIVLTGTAFMETNPESYYPPALQSPFFIPHVLVYMIAYCLGAVAFALVVLSFFRKQKQKDLERAAYCCIRALFPFMTCGMFFGAIWADQVWGDFWSWDIKENWSLVTWLLFMLYLHCYRRKLLKKYTRILAILGFVGIIITFFFVNVMNNTSSVHVYS